MNVANPVNDHDVVKKELTLRNNSKTFNISSQDKFDFVCDDVPYFSCRNDIKDTDQITTKCFGDLAIVDSKTDQQIGMLNQSLTSTNRWIIGLESSSTR